MPRPPPFVDERDLQINTACVEIDEQKLAAQYIQASDVVLELGARYGTVTYAINSKLANKSAHVAVEPDSRVWAALEKNVVAHKVSARIWKGFVSKSTLVLEGDDYSTTSVASADSSVPTISFEDLQAREGLRFNALVADCEGFLLQFLQESPSILSQLRIVIFEKDCPHKCDYAKVEALLRNAGLQQIVGGFQNVWERR